MPSPKATPIRLLPQDVEKFLRMLPQAPVTECWIWPKRPRKGKGQLYGRVYVGHPRKNQGAHRISYYLFHGPFPIDLMVCHRCDTPACVNPCHLFLGTAEDNTADRHRKGRDSKGKSHGQSINYKRGKDSWAYQNQHKLLRRGDENAMRKYPEKVPRGEKNGNARLLPEQVCEIRQCAAQGESQTSLGRRFGVSRPTITAIVARRLWAHLK